MMITFVANNVDVALAVKSEIYNSVQDAIDSAELKGIDFFTVGLPMVECKKAPEGVVPFPPELMA